MARLRVLRIVLAYAVTVTHEVRSPFQTCPPSPTGCSLTCHVPYALIFNSYYSMTRANPCGKLSFLATEQRKEQREQ